MTLKPLPLQDRSWQGKLRIGGLVLFDQAQKLFRAPSSAADLAERVAFCPNEHDRKHGASENNAREALQEGEHLGRRDRQAQEGVRD